ncbi:hypothetical protein OXIME_001352 [Oxyplasma meridianum]|uniref:Uncharacterized protein n=1 Tax=Oxyplasma meridianum TaxID=3073602 RepID=A0AAX4NHV4_9ARCH
MRFEDISIDDSFKGKTIREFSNHMEKFEIFWLPCENVDNIVIRPLPDSNFGYDLAILISQNGDKVIFQWNVLHCQDS